MEETADQLWEVPDRLELGSLSPPAQRAPTPPLPFGADKSDDFLFETDQPDFFNLSMEETSSTPITSSIPQPPFSNPIAEPTTPSMTPISRTPKVRTPAITPIRTPPMDETAGQLFEVPDRLDLGSLSPPAQRAPTPSFPFGTDHRDDFLFETDQPDFFNLSTESSLADLPHSPGLSRTPSKTPSVAPIEPGSPKSQDIIDQVNQQLANISGSGLGDDSALELAASPRTPSPRRPTPRSPTPRTPTPRTPTPRTPSPRMPTPRTPLPSTSTLLSPRIPSPSPIPAITPGIFATPHTPTRTAANIYKQADAQYAELLSSPAELDMTAEYERCS